MKRNQEIPQHLQKTDPEDFFLRREKRGKGFRFVHNGGKPVKDENLLEFISNIPVPNTWSDVKLCEKEQGHILASGYDGSDNLQYLYHPDYLDFRNKQKFANLAEFGMTLPRLRRKLRRDMKGGDWDEQKLLALIVRILDKYHLRIGTRVYAQKNQSFGLTTLRKRHLKEIDTTYHFEYSGKSGQQRKIQLSDPYLVELVEELDDFPGWELFSFRANGEKVVATGQKVNDYIRNVSNADFSARTFRTWAGTVLAVKLLDEAKKEVEENPRRKLKTALVEKVAGKLGNTPSICEEYYIHPKVLKKVTEPNFDANPCDEKFLKNTLFRKHECRTMEILTGS